MRYNHNMPSPPPLAPAPTPRRLAWEVWIVMGLSLGRPGVTAAIALTAASPRAPTANQTPPPTLSYSAPPASDPVSQLLPLLFPLLPVPLAFSLTPAHRPRL